METGTATGEMCIRDRCGILLGDNVDGIAAELGEYGADKVYVYNAPLLKDFTTDAYTLSLIHI